MWRVSKKDYPVGGLSVPPPEGRIATYSVEPDVVYTPSQKTMTLRVGMENTFTLTPEVPIDVIPAVVSDADNTIIDHVIHLTEGEITVGITGLSEGTTTLVIHSAGTGKELGRLKVTVRL